MDVEIIEKYREGKLYERIINGVCYPVSPEEAEMVVWGSWNKLPDYIEEVRTMTREEVKNRYGKII